jgi:Beta-galactosidase, domain 3/Beta-galactosidase, domain 2
VPQTSSYIDVIGRDSKLIACDLTFGNSSHVLYSTASILWAGKLGDRDALFLYGDNGLEHEAVIKFKGRSPYFEHRLEYTIMNGGFSLVNIARGVTGLVTIWDSSEQIVLFSDMDTAATMWFPVLPFLPIAVDPFSHYWQFGTNRTILVGGPYLVRSARLSGPDDTILELRGDLKDSVRLVLIGIPTNVRTLTWNGQPVGADLSTAVSNARASSIVRTASIVPRHFDSPVASFEPPVLKQWKYVNGLPEIGSGFPDSNWVLANHTSTNIPYKPYGNGTVLYGCDYGLWVLIECLNWLIDLYLIEHVQL